MWATSVIFKKTSKVTITHRAKIHLANFRPNLVTLLRCKALIAPKMLYRVSKKKMRLFFTNV
jgi:hypothetical protein